MEEKNYNAEYQKLSNELFEQLKAQYIAVIQKARRPQDAHNLFIEKVMKSRGGELAEKMTALGTTINFIQNLEDTYALDNTKDKPEIFNEQIKKIKLSKRDKTVALLAEHQAQVLMDEYWFEEKNKHNAQLKIQPEVWPEFKSSLFWKGVNETEFVQFAYALSKAGYLEHDEKKITVLVEDLAHLLNFQLGNNWQVQLSSSIHKRNSDYEPKIFDTVKNGYAKYREEQINKKKKN